MYTNQKLQVKWGTHTSPMFEVTNGVKQGGFMLTNFICCLSLKKNGVGCQMSKTHCFSVEYWMSFICR